MAHDQLTLDLLTTAARPGGPSVLTAVTALAPAAGPHASIAPARYTTRQGNPTYVYEDRFIDGKPAMTVLIDSKSSMANRMETAILDAIADGHDLLARWPRIEVKYGAGAAERSFSCLTLPHRAFDAHIRAGKIGSTPTTQDPGYIEARNSDQSNALAMLNASFATPTFGAWDSSRKARQARYPSLLVGEIIGVLANQDSDEPREAKHSGARVDPVAMGLDLDAKGIQSILEPQRHEYSAKLASSKSLKPSTLGLAAIPPGTDDLAGIATRSIIRSHVLSFALLRRLRFGKGPDGDAAIRVLIAAALINAAVRSNSELLLRANCHLVESSTPEWKLDQRNGNHLQLEPLDIAAADDLLSAAYEAAKGYGVVWGGVTMAVTGNDLIWGAIDDSDKE